jgi:hypothetical protein
MAYSRYKNFIVNGKIISVPTIPIKNRETDVYVEYNSAKTRLDRIAGEIYSDENYWWVIIMGNPQYYMEYDIPAGTTIRVPFPLQDVLYDYQQAALNIVNNL